MQVFFFNLMTVEGEAIPGNCLSIDHGQILENLSLVTELCMDGWNSLPVNCVMCTVVHITQLNQFKTCIASQMELET